MQRSKNLSPGLRNQRPQLFNVLPITLKPPSRLRRRKKRRRNKRDVIEKEGLRISPQLLGPIVPTLAKKKAKETAPTIETQAKSSVETVTKGTLHWQVPRVIQAEKLVSVLATSALVTGANKEAQEVILDRVLCIYYPVQFRKDKEVIRTLINSRSKINTMTPAYAKQLGLQAQKTDIGAQKIDGSLLWTFGMVIASFQIEDKLGRTRFF